MAIPPQSGTTLHEAVVKLHDEADFDVIALQEVDVQQSRSGLGNQIADVAEVLGAKHWAFAPSMYGTPGEKWHGVKDDIVFDNTSSLPNEAMYGIGIVSKVPVKRWHRINLGNLVGDTVLRCDAYSKIVFGCVPTFIIPVTLDFTIFSIIGAITST